MNNLHDWIFHYNVYTSKWEAAKRDNYTDLFSSRKENILRSSRIETLVEIIRKTNGEKKKINQLVK
jgi:hypothetical protein